MVVETHPWKAAADEVPDFSRRQHPPDRHKKTSEGKPHSGHEKNDYDTNWTSRRKGSWGKRREKKGAQYISIHLSGVSQRLTPSIRSSTFKSLLHPSFHQTRGCRRALGFLQRTGRGGRIPTLEARAGPGTLVCRARWVGSRPS